MKLRFCIIAIAAFIGFTSCEPSNEEKAQKMAAEYLKGTLFHFDSYEPLQTKVDSMFVSLSSDKEAIDLTLDLVKMFELADKYLENVTREESSMNIWEPNGYSSSYSKGEYEQAKKKRDENQASLERTRERIMTQFDKIKARQASIKTGEFNGWKVYHKFKSLNGSGTLDLLGEYIFLCDENFQEENVFSQDEYKQISLIIDAIAESDDVYGFVEKLQDIIM